MRDGILYYVMSLTLCVTNLPSLGCSAPLTLRYKEPRNASLSSVSVVKSG